MEVAGLVLGAIPIVITALQYSRDMKKFKQRFTDRKTIVRRLIEALQMQQGELELNLQWLGKAIQLDKASIFEISLLLARPGIQCKIVEYLGEAGSKSFLSALKQAQRAVENVCRNIRGFLFDKQGIQGSLATISHLYASDSGALQCNKSLKLLLGEDDVKEEIRQLKEATQSLWRLQSMGSNIRQIEVTTPTKNSSKIVKSLARIQAYALRLYGAILVGWAPGCHPTHEALLVLQDRIPSSKTPSLRNKLDFKLIFSSENTPTADILWHEGQVEVIETDHATILPHSHVKASNCSMRITRPAVTFAPAPDEDTLQYSAKDVKDICITIAQAMQERRALKWYLMTPQRLRCCHVAHVGHLPSRYGSQTVTLTNLLKASEMTTDRSKKIPLIPRLSLALTLASTLIQLIMTPWLDTIWSKDSIRFSVKASTGDQKLDARDIDLSHVDLNHPLVTKGFSDAAPTLPPPVDRSEPRRMILELGIILLELLCERTFEDYLSAIGYDSANRHTYQHRRIVAQLWLDESEAHLLPRWYKVTARCIQCSFDNVPANPQWDKGLFKGFVQGVIEPLREECR